MFPKGGMQGLMKQAQQMQKKMKVMEKELQELKIEGACSGKLVIVQANGKKEILSIKIDSSILKEDIEMIEDLIMASIKQTYKNIDNYVEEKNTPDWFGYMRIDKKIKARS